VVETSAAIELRVMAAEQGSVEQGRQTRRVDLSESMLIFPKDCS